MFLQVPKALSPGEDQKTGGEEPASAGVLGGTGPLRGRRAHLLQADHQLRHPWIKDSVSVRRDPSPHPSSLRSAQATEGGRQRDTSVNNGFSACLQTRPSPFRTVPRGYYRGRSGTTGQGGNFLHARISIYSGPVPAATPLPPQPRSARTASPGRCHCSGLGGVTCTGRKWESPGSETRRP